MKVPEGFFEHLPMHNKKKGGRFMLKTKAEKLKAEANYIDERFSKIKI
jgi:hypothetical protein